VFADFFKKQQIFWQMAIKQRWFWVTVTGAVFLFIYYLPYMILGENSYIPYIDNMDWEVITNILGAKYFLHFTGTIPELMGQDVKTLIPLDNFSVFLYMMFPPFAAWIINDFIVRLCAFAGMYLLLNLIFKGRYPFVSVASAIMFASVGFFSQFGLCVAGFPLLAWALWKIFKREKLIWAYLVCALFAMSASLALAGFYVMPILVGICIYFLIKRKKYGNQKHFYIVTSMMAGIYIFFNLNVIILALTGFEGHRDMRNNADYDGLGFFDTMGWSLPASSKLWLTRWIHIGGNSIFPVLLALSAITIGLIFIIKGDVKRMQVKYTKILLFLLMAGFWIAFLSKFIETNFVTRILMKFNMAQFDLTRMYYVLLSLNFLAAGIGLAIIYQTVLDFGKSKWVKIGAMSLTGAIVGSMSLFMLSIPSTSKLGTKCLGLWWVNNSNYFSNFTRPEHMATWRQFYDTKLFGDIENWIYENKHEWKNDYKVASLAMVPAISQYNGFHTIDGFNQNYSIEHWSNFHNIIANELNADLSNSFNKEFNWGNHCMLFSRYVGFLNLQGQSLYGKNNQIQVNELFYNWNAFNAIGGKYILSAVKINIPDTELVHLHEFEGEFWKIQLYEVHV
jgi:uncharacterized membrane protein